MLVGIRGFMLFVEDAAGLESVEAGLVTVVTPQESGVAKRWKLRFGALSSLFAGSLAFWMFGVCCID